jgi:hypothetical protein
MVRITFFIVTARHIPALSRRAHFDAASSVFHQPLYKKSAQIEICLTALFYLTIALRYFPSSSVPREIELERARARVLDSFSPETASKVKSSATKLMIMATINDQLNSSKVCRKGLVLPLLFSKEKTFQALKTAN